MAGQWLGNYGYRKAVSIPAANVIGSGIHTNFPVLIDITDTDLVSAANGGLVQDDNGWDIVFTSTSAPTTQLNHEIEDFDATTGRIVAWVQVPSLNTSADNTFYICFGDPLITTDPSTTATWDPAAYLAVYHFKEDDNLDEATDQRMDAINNGSVNTGGLIGNAQDFQSADNVDFINLSSVDVVGSAITLSAWVNPRSLGNPDASIIHRGRRISSVNYSVWMLGTHNSGQLQFRMINNVPAQLNYQPVVTSLTTGSWQYTTAIYDGTTMNLADNGQMVGGGRAETNPIASGFDMHVIVGNAPSNFNVRQPFDGTIDEVRIQRVARSQGWLETEYNNQLNPTSFYTGPGTLEIKNDDPCDAIELPVNECYTPGIFTNVNSTKSAVADPSCGNYGDV